MEFYLDSRLFRTTLIAMASHRWALYRRYRSELSFKRKEEISSNDSKNWNYYFAG